MQPEQEHIIMKRLKIGLLARIIIAIALGIGFGNILPGGLVRVFVTFNGIFYNPQIQKSGETKTKGSKSGKNRGKSQFQAVIEI